MNFEQIKELSTYIIPLITAAIAWNKDAIKTKLGFKRESASIDTITSENMKSNFQLYQELLNDLEKRYRQQIKNIEETLKQDIQELKQVVESLEATIKEYKNRFGDLN